MGEAIYLCNTLILTWYTVLLVSNTLLRNLLLSCFFMFSRLFQFLLEELRIISEKIIPGCLMVILSVCVSHGILRGTASCIGVLDSSTIVSLIYCLMVILSVCVSHGILRGTASCVGVLHSVRDLSSVCFLGSMCSVMDVCCSVCVEVSR